MTRPTTLPGRPAPGPSGPSGRTASPGLVLFSTSLATFAVFLDTTIGFVSFPAISRTFGTAGADTVSWVLNAYTLVFAALLVPSGRLADRVGRKRMFLLGVVVFTVGSALCGLAPNVGTLIGAEMLEAAGAAFLVPASLALVLQTFLREKVPFAVAIWGALGAVAGAVGPTVGSLVVDQLGWRWAFFINLPVGVVSFALARHVLPEGRSAAPGRLPDALGVVLLSGGVAAMICRRYLRWPIWFACHRIIGRACPRYCWKQRRVVELSLPLICRGAAKLLPTAIMAYWFRYGMRLRSLRLWVGCWLIQHGVSAWGNAAGSACWRSLRSAPGRSLTRRSPRRC